MEGALVWAGAFILAEIGVLLAKIKASAQDMLQASYTAKK